MPLLDTDAILTSLDRLDAAWLGRALGLPVSSLRRAPAAGGIAVTSRIARVLFESDGGPPSVVIKVRNPDWTARALYDREVKFYQRLAPMMGAAVPRCYLAAIDEASGDFTLVIEDLSEASPGHRLDGLDHDEAKRVAATIGRIHGRFWGDPEQASMWPEKRYDEAAIARITSNFDAAWPQLIEQGRYKIPDPLHDAVRALRERLPGALAALSRGSRTLIHSDLHAENFILDGDRVAIFDWQNTAFAHPAFDLAGVLLSSAPEVHQAGWSGPLEAWRRAAIEAGAPDDEVKSTMKDARAAVDWSFAGVAGWLVRFEAESLRDASTTQGHWTRMVAAACMT